MLARILGSRAVGRAAVLSLTVGLAALAGLALWSSGRTAQTAEWVRKVDRVASQWGNVFRDVSIENEAVTDHLRAGTEVGRQPLGYALGSAEHPLRWIETNGGPADAEQAASVHATYLTYTQTLRDLLHASDRGDQAGMSAQAEQAGLVAAALRKQVMANIVRKHLEMEEFLDDVNQRNHTLRLIGLVTSAVDLLLLVLSGILLLTYQRRVERQALDSRHQALHDGLTGIANRVLLADRIEQAVLAARRHDELVALLLLDLNRFKEINDTLGHHHGDLLLCQVAARLRDVVRDNDTVARLGGDEFAVLLPRVESGAAAMEVADRILAAVGRPADLDGVVVDVSCSIGVALHPVHNDTGGELLRHADIAMYAAKRGHLGTVMYDPDGNQHRTGQLGTLAELRRAIEVDEPVPHYQPTVTADNGYVRGGCPVAQGFHIARPMPAAEVPARPASQAPLVAATATGPTGTWPADG